MNSHDLNSNIDIFFAKAKNILSHDYDSLFDQTSYKKKSRPSNLPLIELIKIFNKANVTLDAVIEGRIDYEAMASHLTSKGGMPARYLNKAVLSSRFTGKYMIDYISKNRGEKVAQLLMQNFQLNESQFKDILDKNNIMLSMDLTEYINKYYGSDEVFRMGQHSTVILQNTIQGRWLSDCPNVLTMFEFFCDEIAPLYVEKNFEWTIGNFGTDYLTVCGKPSLQLIDAFHGELRSSTSIPFLHLGFLKSLPDLVGPFHTEVEMLKSIANGDDCNIFKLKYKTIKNIH